MQTRHPLQIHHPTFDKTTLQKQESINVDEPPKQTKSRPKYLAS